MIYTYYDKEPETTPGSVCRFARKRIGKIYPLHILMMLAALPFAVRVLMEDFTVRNLIRSAGQVVLNVFLLQSWIPKSASYFSLNGVAWYLSICVFLYLAFPYILKAVKKYTNNRRAYISMAVIFAIQFGTAFALRNVNVPMSVSDNLAKWVTYISPVFRLGDFVIGCNLGYLFLKRKGNLNRWQATVCELAVFGLLVVSQYVYNGQFGFFSSEWFKLTVMYIPTSALLVYLFARNEGWISRLLTNKLLVYIGDISAYAFLIHQVVIRYLREVLARLSMQSVSNWVVAVTAFVITLICVIIYKKVEEKILLNKRYRSSSIRQS